MAIQVEDIPLAGSVASTLRMAAQAGLIADADLATSEAAVIAAVTAKGLKAHVTLAPLVEGLKKAIPFITRVTGNASLVTGGSLANIYTAIEAGLIKWNPGYSLAL